MDVGTVRKLVSGTSLPDVAACRAELRAIRIVRGSLDSREVEVAARLDELAADEPSMFPEEEVAAAAKSSLLKASRVRSRQRAADDIPQLGDALANGETTGDRLDLVARATHGLSPTEKARVAAHGDELAQGAARLSDREYRHLLERVIRTCRDDDGLDRLARQRAAARLRWWNDVDGMWCLSGRFDPVTGAEMESRLRASIERMFHDHTPEQCPSEPSERQQFLAAQAMAAMCGGGGQFGVPDVTVLIDERTLREGRWHEGSIVDAGLGRFGLPIETIRRWACIGTITPVIVSADGVRLLLGRETRLANRAQRRALRVLYGTCALCDVPFEHTQIHHVTWFRLGGSTDIDNMLPLCARHHHLVHEGGWTLHLDIDRTLTVTRPGGAVSTHGPPRMRAA